MAGGTRDYDVTVLGAGLVGLSLAASLARAGMRVAIVDRSSVDTSNVNVAADSSTDEDWDARVYAVSPGSVAFLNDIGAWQRLRENRLAPIESMDVRGDAGGKHFLGA
jgi:2-polyprenyl-6-methoxyphenol hydroxylase-like FAD-dependent oxidoreductase